MREAQVLTLHRKDREEARGEGKEKKKEKKEGKRRKTVNESGYTKISFSWIKYLNVKNKIWVGI